AGPPPPPSESVSLCVDDPDAFDAAPVPASTQTRRFPYPSAATMVSFVLWQTKTSAGSFGGEIGYARCSFFCAAHRLFCASLIFFLASADIFRRRLRCGGVDLVAAAEVALGAVGFVSWRV